MEIQPKKPSTKGPAEMFTGDVWIDNIAQGQAPSRISVGIVHFTPGARTAWHSHSLGQTLYVTEGEGRVFSTTLGHFPAAYESPAYMAHLGGGLAWALGDGA